jgi:hypothetical protein
LVFFSEQQSGRFKGENGLQLINGLLSYDEKRPISAMNGPKLYISDRCQNLAPFKRVTSLTVRHEEFEKTTTRKLPWPEWTPKLCWSNF